MKKETYVSYGLWGYNKWNKENWEGGYIVRGSGAWVSQIDRLAERS